MGTRALPLPVRVGACAVFLVLAGLLAMHGIGSHGTMSTSHATTSAAAPAHGTHGAHVGHGGTLMDAGTHETMLAPSRPHAGFDHLAGACLVVLGLALLLLLGHSGAVVGRRVALTYRTPSLAVPPRARAPDPPDLLRMSICRC